MSLLLKDVEKDYEKDALYMKDIVIFIQNYWRLILEACICIASFVFCLCRKKPIKVVDTLKEVIVRVLPSLICAVEKTGLKGSDKLNFLLQELAKVLKELNYGDDVIAQYLPFAIEQVELILSTPQKKGIKL